MAFLARKCFFRYTTLAILIIGIAACDSASIEDSEIASSIEFISNDLQFNSEERSALETSFSVNDDRQSREPGYLWYVAETLQENLTDVQRERLLRRLEKRGSLLGRPGFNFGQGAGFGSQFRQRKGFREFGGFAGLGSLADQLALTTEQKDSIIALRSTFRDDLRLLRTSWKEGNLTVDEFGAALDELIAGLRSSWEALLTEDQKATLEQMRADRDAAMAGREAQREADRAAARLVMVQVLQLSDAQVTSLDLMQIQIDELRAAYQELIDSGATREDVRTWASETTTSIVDELEALLDETQFEIFVIHGALHSRAGMKLRKQRRQR